MKTRFVIACVFSVVLLMASCTRDLADPDDGVLTFYADAGDTRTVLQSDGAILWSPKDVIGVYHNEYHGTFTSTNTEAASSVEFKGVLPGFVRDDNQYFYAVYPYSDNNTFTRNSLGMTLPAEQTAVEGTFADDLFISVARTKDDKLYFNNVCGGVKFSVAEDGIKRIVFKSNGGEEIAGTLRVVFDASELPVITHVANGSSSVTLSVPEGGSFQKGEWYYLVLIPCTLSQGFTLEFYDSSSLLGRVKSDEAVQIKRSVWGVLKGLEPSQFVELEAIDLGLSVKWANINLGAKALNDYGDYYSWGETVPNKSSFTWSNYKWGNPDDGFSKYSPEQGITILDPEDDAAVQRLKGNWRMATIDEFNELLTECQWEKVSLDGVVCYKVSRNGNYIYFPAYPGYYDGGITEFGVNGYYWSSTVLTSDWKWAQNLWFKGGIEINRGQRFFGEVIRPVYDDQVHPVSDIHLNETSIRVGVGSSVKLFASFSPANATDRRITWSSSNKAVATVSSTGEVTGVSIGSAMVTATTADGGFTASCEVTVKENCPIPEAIDLGLPSGLKWASFNLGASKPEEYGDYYAWGETDPYYSSFDPLVWYPGKEEGYSWSSYRYYDDGLTKYIPQMTNELSPDGKHALDPNDDAATVLLGKNWRMPTLNELEGLFYRCSLEWKSENGFNYLKLQGPNGNYIILPAGGYFDGTSHSSLPAGFGVYWSREIYYYYKPAQAGTYIFNNEGFNDRYDMPRRYGCFIRAVYTK